MTDIVSSFDHLDLSISKNTINSLTTNLLDVLAINFIINSLNTAYHYG